MKYWNDYLTREDMESKPGVIDCEKIRILSLNLYLKYIEGCVELICHCVEKRKKMAEEKDKEW